MTDTELDSRVRDMLFDMAWALLRDSVTTSCDPKTMVERSRAVLNLIDDEIKKLAAHELAASLRFGIVLGRGDLRQGVFDMRSKNGTRN
jgi:hypothetical protein